MAAKTAWAGGLLGGVSGGSTAFFPAFNATDFTSLANLASVCSSIATFDNTIFGDQFMDISFSGLIASSTIASGAGLAFFLWCLTHDGVLGDPRLAPGVQTPAATYAPLMNPAGGIPISAGTAVTVIAGTVLGIPIPSRQFRLAMQNQTGFALASGGCQISTYRQNTNA